MARRTLRIPDQRQYDYLKSQSPGTDYPEPPCLSSRCVSRSGLRGNLLSGRADRGAEAIRYEHQLPGDTNPSFTLAVTVREGRLTDGVTTGSAAAGDVPVDGTPQWGGAQPAAYRIWSGAPGNVTTGPMGLLWSS